MSRFPLLVTAWLAWLSFASAQPGRRATPPDQSPIFRSNTQLVTVGVVVLNRAGKPVRDLTLSEVQLKDNGRLQQIRSFEPTKFGVDFSSAGSTQRLPPGYHSNRETYQSPASAVFLLMDSLNTPFEDQTYAIRAAQHAGAMKTKLLPIQGAFLLDRFGSLQTNSNGGSDRFANRSRGQSIVRDS